MWLDCRVHNFYASTNYECYLNDKLLEHCFAANEEEGWADVYVLYEPGLLIWKETDVKQKKTLW